MSESKFGFQYVRLTPQEWQIDYFDKETRVQHSLKGQAPGVPDWLWSVCMVPALEEFVEAILIQNDEKVT